MRQQQLIVNQGVLGLGEETPCLGSQKPRNEGKYDSMLQGKQTSAIPLIYFYLTAYAQQGVLPRMGLEGSSLDTI